jgi:hypothetical protein
MRVLTLLVLALLGCGKSDKAAPSGDTGTTDDVRRAVPRLTSMLASATTPTGVDRAGQLQQFYARTENECRNMVYVDKISDATLAAQYKKLCTHDIPIAIVRMGVEIAEAARKDKPDGDLTAECYDKTVGIAHGELERDHTADGDSRALDDRLKVVCPK